MTLRPPETKQLRTKKVLRPDQVRPSTEVEYTPTICQYPSVITRITWNYSPEGVAAREKTEQTTKEFICSVAMAAVLFILVAIFITIL